MDKATGTGNRQFRVAARLRRWRTHFHCLACGEYFPRDKPYCPYCKNPQGRPRTEHAVRRLALGLKSFPDRTSLELVTIQLADNPAEPGDVPRGAVHLLEKRFVWADVTSQTQSRNHTLSVGPFSPTSTSSVDMSVAHRWHRVPFHR